MLENFREAFDGIRSHKLRSALTMLGIIIGIASIIAISSTIMGTNEQIKQNLVGSGSNVVTVRLYQGDYPFESAWSTLPSYVPPLTDETLEEIRAIPEVADAAFYAQRDAYGQIRSSGNALSLGTIYGIDGSYFSVYGYTVRSGRGFTANDLAQYRKVAMIDETVSAALFSGSNPVGKTIDICGEPYIVIGEFTRLSDFRPKVSTLDEYFTYNTSTGGKVLIPFSTWPVLFRYDEPRSLVLRAVNTDSMTAALRATVAARFLPPRPDSAAARCAPRAKESETTSIPNICFTTFICASDSLFKIASETRTTSSNQWPDCIPNPSGSTTSIKGTSPSGLSPLPASTTPRPPSPKSRQFSRV